MYYNALKQFAEIRKLQKDIKSVNGSLVMYNPTAIAETDGQTEFTINLSTFDSSTDALWVQSGITMLSPALDFSVSGNKVVLNEGVPLGRTLTFYVFKNVSQLDNERTLNGVNIGIGTMPVDRLTEKVVTSDVTMHMKVNADGGVTLVWEDET